MSTPPPLGESAPQPHATEEPQSVKGDAAEEPSVTEPRMPAEPVLPEQHNDSFDPTIFKRLLGSAIVVAIFTFLIAALTFYGVINVGLGRLFLVFIWLLSVAGIVFSEWTWRQKPWVKTVVGIVAAAIFGTALINLDTWARHHGPQEQSSVVQPRPEAGAGGTRLAPASGETARPPSGTLPVPSAKPLQPRSKGKPSEPPSPANSAPIIETAPTFGNLADRANTLADEITKELVQQGLLAPTPSFPLGVPPASAPKLPSDPHDRAALVESVSGYFRFRYLDRVLSMRDEFAQLHIRDERLDEFCDRERLYKQEYQNQNSDPPSISPYEIEQAAQTLRDLSRQLPQRAAPRSLAFSVTKVPDSAKAPCNVVVTITSDKDLYGGYIATEFNGSLGHLGDDAAGTKPIFEVSDEETEGNEQLESYRRTHSLDSYILKIGTEPILANKPFHVCTSSTKAGFTATRVLFFEK